jgi:rhodanese-related sulfurtransferase
MPSLVSQIPAAPASMALTHFSNRLAFETDCSDVHASVQAAEVDYVLLDVRAPHAFAAGHVPGAVNLPYRTLTAEHLAAYPCDTLFVVYCAGPHCNAVHRAAARLAAHGFAVKEMIGGITGWLDEGFALSQTGPGEVRLGCEC